MRRLFDGRGVPALAAAIAGAIVVGAAGTACAARPGADQLKDIALRPQFVSPYPPFWLAVGLALVLGGVWLTYGYVLHQVWKLFREDGDR